MMSQRPRPRWYCFQTCTLRPQSKCRYLYCIVEAYIGLIGYFYLVYISLVADLPPDSAVEVNELWSSEGNAIR